jgi:hypothetical protein
LRDDCFAASLLSCFGRLQNPSDPWVALQRRDFANDEGEIYVPVLVGENIPDGVDIMAAFDMG